MLLNIRKTVFTIIVLAIGITSIAQTGQDAPVKKKKGKHLNDQGITNSTHQKYIDQIVWSNSRVSKDNPDETAFKNKFNANEYIYGRFYLSESMQNFIYHNYRKILSGFSFYFDVYIDDVKQEPMLNFTNIGSDYCTVTTWQILVHVPRVKNDYGSSADWVPMINKNMKPGEHTVRLDLRVKNYEGVIVSGSFIYVKGEEDIKYGWNLESYTTGMKDEAIESEILKTIQKHSEARGWKEKFSKVKIGSNDWTILTNENTGVIVGRSLDVFCQATWPDGHCTVQLFSFTQQYNGSDYQKSFYVDGVGKQEPADCQ